MGQGGDAADVEAGVDADKMSVHEGADRRFAVDFF